MKNGQMDRGNEKPTQHLPWRLRKITKKTPVRLVGTGIWTRDLPNASLVRYHGATSLGPINIAKVWSIKNSQNNLETSVSIWDYFQPSPETSATLFTDVWTSMFPLSNKAQYCRSVHFERRSW